MPDNMSGRGVLVTKRTGGTEHNVKLVHWSYQVDKQHSGDVGYVRNLSVSHDFALTVE